MKRLFSAILAVSVIFLCACAAGNRDVGVATTDNGTADNVTESVSETSEASLSADEIYEDFLAKLYKKLNAIFGDDTHLDGFGSQTGMQGVAEIAWADRLNVMKRVGYTTLDLTGDGVPELLLCALNDQTDIYGEGTRILAVFTASGNEVKLLYDGTELNRHYLLNNGTLYNEISNGVMTVIAATYQFDNSKEGASCQDFYFVDFDKNDQPHYYHNQSEKLDVSISEPVDGGADGYNKILEEFRDGISVLETKAIESFQD